MQTGRKGLSDSPRKYAQRTSRQIFMEAGQKKVTPEEEKPQQETQEKQSKTIQDELEVGDRVLIKHQQTGRWNKEAEVVEQRNDKLSYVIRDNTGQILVRGLRLLKPKPPSLARSDLMLRSHTRQQTGQEADSRQETFSTPLHHPKQATCTPYTNYHAIRVERTNLDRCL